MLYDLFADFYEKSSDRHPKYIVLMELIMRILSMK